MITITIDKRSELEWLRSVIETGLLNISENEANKLLELGVPRNQKVNYKPSDVYEEDITEGIRRYNSRIQKEQNQKKHSRLINDND